MLRQTLFALVVFGALAVLSVATKPLAAAASGSCDVSDASIDGEERTLIDTINSYRAQNSLPQLSVSSALERTATWMAADLVKNGSFGHTDTLGRPFYTRAKDCGYAWPGGENIAAGTNSNTGSAAFSQFRNSAEHNAIMLDGDFTQIGAARAQGGAYGWYWAVEFGYREGDPTPAPPPPAPPAPPPAAAPAVHSAPPVVAASAPDPAPPAPPPVDPGPQPFNWDATTILPSDANLITWTGVEAAAADIFGESADGSVVVYTYNPWYGVWLHYSPGAPAFLQTLDVLEPGTQYWILITNP